jgi:hypothetical protein
MILGIVSALDKVLQREIIMNDAIDFILWAAGFVAVAQFAAWILNGAPI